MKLPISIQNLFLSLLFFGCVIINAMQENECNDKSPLTVKDYAFLNQNREQKWWSNDAKYALLIEEEAEFRWFAKPDIFKNYYIADLEKKYKHRISSLIYHSIEAKQKNNGIDNLYNDLVLHPNGKSVFMAKRFCSDKNILVYQVSPSCFNEDKLDHICQIYESQRNIKLCCHNDGNVFFIDSATQELFKQGDYEDAHTHCLEKTPPDANGRTCYCHTLEKINDAQKIAEVKTRLEAKVILPDQLQQTVQNDNDGRNLQQSDTEQKQLVSKIKKPVLIAAASIGILGLSAFIIYKAYHALKARKKQNSNNKNRNEQNSLFL